MTGEEIRTRTGSFRPRICGVNMNQRCVLVDLRDDEVAPVDESDRLSFFQSLGVGSFDQNARSVPNFLHADLFVL